MNSTRLRVIAGTAAVAMLLWSSQTLAWHSHWGQPRIVGNGRILNVPAFPFAYSDTNRQVTDCSGAQKYAKGGSKFHLRGLDVTFDCDDLAHTGFRRVTIKASSVADVQADPKSNGETVLQKAYSNYKIWIPIDIADGMRSNFAIEAYVRFIGGGEEHCRFGYGCSGNREEFEGQLLDVKQTGIVWVPDANDKDGIFLSFDKIADDANTNDYKTKYGFIVNGLSGEAITTGYVEKNGLQQSTSRLDTKELMKIVSPGLQNYTVCNGAYLVVALNTFSMASAHSTNVDLAKAVGGTELVLTVTLSDPSWVPKTVTCPVAPTADTLNLPTEDEPVE